MERLCRRCQKPHRRKGLTEYCSSECRNAAIERECENPLCRTKYVPKNMARPNKYCSTACSLVANRAKTEQGVKRWRARVVAERPPVMCALPTCPRPDEPIPMKKSQADDSKNHYHVPDCLREFMRQGGGARRHPLKEAFCADCGTARGRRTVEYTQLHPYCRPCGRARRVWTRRSGSTQIRRCAYSVCGRALHVPASKARKAKTSYCNLAHYNDARHERATVPIRCTACGEQRDYRPAMIPVSVDRATMTWVCVRCRPHKSAIRLLTCAHCEQPFRRRVKLGEAERLHFCRMAHLLEYHRERRRTVVCQVCGKTTVRRHGGLYCGSKCYGVSLQGQPRPERGPSTAEMRVIRKWEEGIRGIRHLAAATGVSTTTVLKLKQAGKLVEPTAARSA